VPDTAPRPADYVMRLMAEAAKANEKDRFLRGHLVELPADGNVLVTGDLHGHVANFQRILKIADLPHHPRRHLILQEVLHSMYDDTPDRSYQLLEDVAVLKSVYPSQVHVLLANHDLSELLDLDIMKKGRSVLHQFDAALEEAYQFNKDVVRNAYLGFLRTLPWVAATATGLFICHSIPDGRHLDLFSRDLFTRAPGPDDLARNSAAFRLVWGRDVSGPTAADFARRVGADLILTGHHPCREGHAQPNSHHIILDCKDARGAYLLIPLDQRFTQEQLVARIRRLNF
jgi:hypothetical protein